jgi:hypothetical protein
MSTLLKNRRVVRRFVASYGALIFIAVVVFLFTEPSRWNRPVVKSQTQTGEIEILNEIFSYELNCTCPMEVIENQNVTLAFKITLTRNRIPIGNVPTTSSGPPPPAALLVDAGSTTVFQPKLDVQNPVSLHMGEKMVTTVPVVLLGVKTDLSRIDFTITELGGSSSPRTLEQLTWPMASKPPFKQVLIPYLYAAAVILAGGGLFFWLNLRLSILHERTEKQLSAAQTMASANPAVARFAWDLARVKLEAYFDRNLIQVNLVFWVASIVMGVGFCFVLMGVWLAYITPNNIKPPLVAAISGIITQFIGATFMVIYRSTMAQANDFMIVLERINSVGMAVQVLDSLRDGTDLKDNTRAELAKLLLGLSTRSASKSC